MVHISNGISHASLCSGQKMRSGKKCMVLLLLLLSFILWSVDSYIFNSGLCLVWPAGCAKW